MDPIIYSDRPISLTLGEDIFALDENMSLCNVYSSRFWFFAFDKDIFALGENISSRYNVDGSRLWLDQFPCTALLSEQLLRKIYISDHPSPLSSTSLYPPLIPPILPIPPLFQPPISLIPLISHKQTCIRLSITNITLSTNITTNTITISTTNTTKSGIQEDHGDGSDP